METKITRGQPSHSAPQSTLPRAKTYAGMVVAAFLAIEVVGLVLGTGLIFGASLFDAGGSRGEDMGLLLIIPIFGFMITAIPTTAYSALLPAIVLAADRLGQTRRGGQGCGSS